MGPQCIPYVCFVGPKTGAIVIKNHSASRHETKTFDFRDFPRWIAECELPLPDFRPDFVCDPNQVVDLLASTSHGWPIGSLPMLEGSQPFGLKDAASR